MEIITAHFIPCLLKVLHKAPRLSRQSGVSCRDTDYLVSPYDSFGASHQACLDANIPVIVARENKTCLNHPEHTKVIRRWCAGRWHCQYHGWEQLPIAA